MLIGTLPSEGADPILATNVLSSRGIALIKQCEGFRSTRYLDSAGKPTIGYGHLIKPGESFTVVDEAQADALLRADVRTAECAVKRQVTVPLNAHQYDALVSFTYNVGEGALQKSTLRQKLNQTNYLGASVEFDRWVYAGGKRVQGLVTRRVEERNLFLNR